MRTKYAIWIASKMCHRQVITHIECGLVRANAVLKNGRTKKPTAMYGKLIEVVVIFALETYSWNIQIFSCAVLAERIDGFWTLFRTHKNFAHYSNFKFCRCHTVLSLSPQCTWVALNLRIHAWMAFKRKRVRAMWARQQQHHHHFAKPKSITPWFLVLQNVKARK